jgi:hypothetical protein
MAKSGGIAFNGISQQQLEQMRRQVEAEDRQNAAAQQPVEQPVQAPVEKPAEQVAAAPAVQEFDLVEEIKIGDERAFARKDGQKSALDHARPGTREIGSA